MIKKPKILFFDVETKPVKAWIWRTGKQHLNHDQIVDGEKFDIICICYKWADENKIHSLDWGLNVQNSIKMIEKFSKIAESADIVVAHNADQFDIKQINTQRLIHGQAPIDWPVSDDTLKAFRKFFYLPTNRLDYIAKLLFGEGKDPMGFQDWIQVVQYKNAKALKKMIKYCAKDVRLLANAYKRIAPFLTPKIHVGLLNGLDKASCPACGAGRSMSIGRRVSATRIYQRLRCRECGKAYRGSTIKKGDL